MCPEVIDSYGNVKVVKTEDYELPRYVVFRPEFSDAEKKILSDPRSLVGDLKKIMKDLEALKTSGEKEAFLKNYLAEQLNGQGVSGKNVDSMVSIIMDEVFLGYGIIGDLMRDEKLEEIMINGIKTPIFVFHREHGMCVTNLQCDTRDSIENIISWLTKYAGRDLSEKKPLLDAHMPDGSRANVAVSPAAPYGPAITIRKFKRVPYTILDLIELNTLNSELAAFLWVCVEGLGLKPVDMIIAGGAGSGKTTLLNALAMFIPKTERVVTVEDTLELNFSFMENWVPMEATPYVFMEETTQLDMHSLVKNSLRMRPDRVIVGEVRGPEAETLLVAMDIGLNGSMGTIHANNARETTIRLMDAPMSVPIRMIPLIELMVVMNKIFDRNKGTIRRVTEVAEISGIEKDVVQLGPIYKWDVQTDQVVRTEFPILLKEKIAKQCGISNKRLNAEIYVRQKILEYMIKRGIRDNTGVINFFQRYHKDPKVVIDEIKDSLKLNTQSQ